MHMERKIESAAPGALLVQTTNGVKDSRLHIGTGRTAATSSCK